MTRKHFVALAATLKEHDAPAELVSDVARICKQANPAFDRARFMQAAGVPA